MTGPRRPVREDFTGPAHLASSVMIVSYALRTYRLREGLTLEQMGARLGRTGGHLSRVERGVRLGPDPAHAAERLGISVAELLRPCEECGWDPGEGTVCWACECAQPAARLAAEIVSWVTAGGEAERLADAEREHVRLIIAERFALWETDGYLSSQCGLGEFTGLTPEEMEAWARDKTVSDRLMRLWRRTT